MAEDDDWRGEHLIRAPKIPTLVSALEHAKPIVRTRGRARKRQTKTADHEPIIRKYAAQGMRQVEIAAAMGLSKARISQLIKQLGIKCGRCAS